MASLDEGVVNLQRFIGLLVTATSAVGQVGDHVKESAGRFEELAGEAEEDGGGLNDELTELRSTVETEEAEAVQAMADLGQAASDAQETVSDAQEKVERAASDLEEKAGVIETDVEQAAAQLSSEGFQPLAQALEEAGQELETEVQEEEQAFTELESAVGTFETEAEAAWNEAEAALDEATADMAEAETALQAEAAEGAQGFDTAGGELEADCTQLDADVDQVYDLLDSGVEAQGNAWEQAVQAAAQQALGFVADGRQQRLEQPAAVVDDEALAPLDQEYEALGTVLDASEPVVTGLEPLAEDLVKSQAVVTQIDELMNALAS